MSEAKHTKGPWRISQNVSRHVIGPKGGVVTCGELTWDGPGSTEVADANARLIAAAPEMLDELINMTARFKAAIMQAGTDEEFAELAVASARAIIARARGEAA